MTVGNKVNGHRKLPLILRVVRETDGDGKVVPVEIRRIQLVEIERVGQRRQPDLAQRRDPVLCRKPSRVFYDCVKLCDLVEVVAAFFLLFPGVFALARDVDHTGIAPASIVVGHLRRITCPGPAGLEFLKDLVISNLQETPACAGDKSSVRAFEHFVGILLVRDAQCNTEARIAPDLIVHDAARLLGCKDQVHAQRPTDPSGGHQGPHEFGLLLFQLREFVRNDDEMGHRLVRLAVAVKLDVLVYVFDLVLVEYALTVPDLRVDGQQRPRRRVSAQVGDHARQMRQTVKALRHAAALVVDQDEGYLVGMVVDRKAQDVGLQGLRFTGAGGACHKTVRAVILFMDVQINRFASRFLADHRLHRLVCAIFKPFVVDIQLLDAGDLVHIQEREHIRDLGVLRRIAQFKAGKRSRKPIHAGERNLVIDKVLAEGDLRGNAVSRGNAVVILDDSVASGGKPVGRLGAEYHGDPRLLRRVEQVFGYRFPCDHGQIRHKDHIMGKKLLVFLRRFFVFALQALPDHV